MGLPVFDSRKKKMTCSYYDYPYMQNAANIFQKTVMVK